MAANVGQPAQEYGHLTRHGLGWFAKLVFIEDIKSAKDIDQLVEESGEYADRILEGISSPSPALILKTKKMLKK